MFAKSAVFFFALVAFVNAAPVTDSTSHPDVHSLSPIKTPPSDGVDYTINPVVHPSVKIPLTNGGYEIEPAAPKRDLSVDVANQLGTDILNLISYIAADIHKRENFAGLNLDFDANVGVDLPGNGVTLDLDINEGKAVHRRAVVIDSQVLFQLQLFATNTANLLRSLGKGDVVGTLVSEINNLRTEVQNGTLDADDLLNAARDIISRVLQ